MGNIQALVTVKDTLFKPTPKDSGRSGVVFILLNNDSTSNGMFADGYLVLPVPRDAITVYLPRPKLSGTMNVASIRLAPFGGMTNVFLFEGSLSHPV